jgi:hypothetical protein
LPSNAFDILCGALGGTLGACAWNALMHRRPRGGAAPRNPAADRSARSESD